MENSMRMVSVVAVLFIGGVFGTTPKYAPTYDMKLSTAFMPCNDSGFLEPEISKGWGLIDFDWSNAKRDWTLAKPMDCEERLVEQAAIVKSVNPKAKVWVYRNLVKALPWYTSVREKIMDPQYSGFFLKFKEGGSLPNDQYHVPACSKSLVGNQEKCSEFYHDQEQTPQNGAVDFPFNHNGWEIYINYNGVSGENPCKLGDTNSSCVVWRNYSQVGSNFPTWEDCATYAESVHAKYPQYTTFTHWPGACWFSHGPVPGHSHDQANHTLGFKGPASEKPIIASNYNVCEGDCDCGDTLPCGEYLWDHRNGSMLRNFLINEFILNNKTGLGNANVDGFYFDDGWTNKPAAVPPWAPPSYKQCDMWSTGGATEEDYYCIVDMGLSAEDVEGIKAGHDTTMTDVFNAIENNNGFSWQLLTERAGSLDLEDPRKTCTANMRSWCSSSSPLLTETWMFGMTRKTFHDPFPLPFPKQDVAQFLLARQDYAYIGHSWMGCVQPNGYVVGNSTKGYERPPEFEQDYGVPVDKFCSETGANTGVFTRKWTKASVSLDCNSWEATIITSTSN